MKNNLKPHHVGISVASIQDSVKWYADVLGFEHEVEYDFASIKSKVTFIKKDDFRIELFEHYASEALSEERKSPLADIKKQGTKHLCFCMEEGLEQLFEAFKIKNVDIVIGPLPSPPGDALMGFIRDPTGNLIEIIQMYR